MRGLMPVEQAISQLLADANIAVEQSKLTIQRALGRIVAEDVFSSIDLPPQDNSAMDGYALNWTDWQQNPLAHFPVSQRIAAGVVPGVLKPGTFARIFTGGELPENANTVVIQEDCELQADGSVSVATDVVLAQNVRPKGQDIAIGDLLIKRGVRLSATKLSLLAAAGVSDICVYSPLRVAILATGDELVAPGEPLAAGKIYNSNSILLESLLVALGCEVVFSEHVADDAAATETALRAASECADLVISCGGVSVGEEDHVKAQVERLGQIKLWKLAIKPGKPFAYGEVCGVPFLGLPGNPSSVFVTFKVLVQPYIKKVMGASDIETAVVKLPLAQAWKNSGVRQEYLRGRVCWQSNDDVEGAMKVQLYPNQSSGMVTSMSWANVLVLVPPQTQLEVGDVVQVLPLDHFG